MIKNSSKSVRMCLTTEDLVAEYGSFGLVMIDKLAMELRLSSSNIESLRLKYLVEYSDEDSTETLVALFVTNTGKYIKVKV